MLTFIVEGSGGAELTYELTKPVVTVGASSQNDVIIRSPGVAPRHLVIQRNADVVTFLGQSRQIVALNGERRSRGVLRPGDRLRVGSATLVVKEIGEIPAVSEGEAAAQRSQSSTRTAAAAASDTPSTNGKRSEVVLYSEPTRLAEARGHLVDMLRASQHVDLVPHLESFLKRTFAGRLATVAVLDSAGSFQPVVAQFQGELPRLPARTFDELGSEGRFALVRLGSRQLMIFPVDRGEAEERAYLIAETGDNFRDDDELLLAELARILAINWIRIEQSSALFGAWETANRKLVEERLPGSSSATRALREGILKAARSHFPALICGDVGSGRSWTAQLISLIHPTAEPAFEVISVTPDDGKQFLAALGGSTELESLATVVDRHGRGTSLLIRNLHDLDLSLQNHLAKLIREDLKSDFGPSLRWLATATTDCVSLAAEGSFDPTLFQVFHRHLLAIPSLEQRREDLALLIVRLLEEVSSELRRDLRGIDLETLNSLLTHRFQGQVAELIGELRRLVAATPNGDIIRGIVPAVLRSGSGGSVPVDDASGGQSTLLAMDDLKTVIPAVEKMIIDRVLRRTLGNQSKAARQLNLSRGALIAKMKDYEIPDYRYLRRRR